MKKALFLLLLASVVAGCSREFPQRAIGDLRVIFSHAPSPAHVGNNTLRVRITDTGGQSISPSKVQFHYYPFIFRVKDSLASPDEVVRVADAAPDQDGYRASANFEKPGPWKVTLRIVRPEQLDALVTFTVEVQGKTG